MQNNPIILYHGSKSGIIGKIQPRSRNSCDFGCGFYMGTSVKHVSDLVCSFDDPKIYTLQLNLTGLKVLELPLGSEWCYVVAYNRGTLEHKKNTKLYKIFSQFLDGYDVIIGKIANDRIYNSLSQFYQNAMTDTALYQCLSFMDLGMQFVCKTEKACKNIKIISESKIIQAELLEMRKTKEKEIGSIVSKTEQIRVSNLRNGLFFNEIIEKYETESIRKKDGEQ